MKKCVYFGAGIVVYAIAGILMSCNGNKDNNNINADSNVDTVYVTVRDTVFEENDSDIITELEDRCRMLQDSIDAVRSSVGEDLFVARYKLGRIKYYTNIVDKKPSQLKYYKGWINRVLNE